jgi:SAM-dependent methyltransferase
MASGLPVVGKNSLPLQIRVVTNDQDAKFDSVIDRIESLAFSALSTSEKTETSLMCQIVRLMDHKLAEDVFLPVSRTPCLLLSEGRSYVSNPEVQLHDIERITSVLDGVVKTAERGRVVGDVNPPDVTGEGRSLPADAVIYVPDSRYHVRLFVSSGPPSFESESRKFSFFKDNAPLWNVHVCQGSQNMISLYLSPCTLHAQLQRMKAGQTHGFSLLTRDFVRNACSLAREMGLDPSNKRRLFFPGVFDIAADVRNHYDTKVARFTSQENSAAGAIRKYNNLVKSCILAQYVPSDSVVLDLACGHGQDLMKYRSKNPRLFVGTDIAQAALTEASRRHKQGRLRYPAEFIQGNLMLQDIFDRVSEAARSHGVIGDSQFDIVSIQLAIHYIIGSKEHADEFLSRVASLVKPGGRLIATFPCCERIANRLQNVTPTDESFSEFAFGNELYKVSFEPSEILKLIPNLRGVYEHHSREEFESVMSETDREDMLTIVSHTWGAKYKFWLVDTIDNQEEYMVPLIKLQAGLQKFGFVTEYTGNFAEIINENTASNSSVIVDFRKSNPDLVLSDAEEDVFRFYRAAVFRKE